MVHSQNAIGSKQALLSLLLLFMALGFLSGQTSPRFIKTAISDSGAKLYLPGTPDAIDVSYSPDSAVVYTIETIDSTTGAYYHFGSIVVNLNGGDIIGQEEEMLESYMDYLKSIFKIEKSAGYGRGHILPTHPTAKGVLDYWEDDVQDHWIVKGWAAESTIFIMFVYGPADYPYQGVVDLFFNGARFKGD